ncbi:MAG TPA: hypothetical protein VKW04_16020 [Planctomycetota bacterium]|nr:hypothetical protein [Planctomycetota bacterium]
MNRPLRIQWIAIVILTLIAAYVALPIPNKPGLPFNVHLGRDLAGGAELRYKLLFDPGFKGDRQKATREATDVLGRRIEANQLKEPKITSHGDDEIILQLPGVDADGLRDTKRLIERAGKLELFAAASQNLQDRYAVDAVIPDGYTPVKRRDGAVLLVRKHPVIEGRQVTNAEAHQDVDVVGAPWVVRFELDAEGAKRFDDAAEQLYHESPRGRIAIVLDGELRSSPVVQSPAFHGRGQITVGRE